MAAIRPGRDFFLCNPSEGFYIFPIRVFLSVFAHLKSCFCFQSSPFETLWLKGCINKLEVTFFLFFLYLVRSWLLFPPLFCCLLSSASWWVPPDGSWCGLVEPPVAGGVNRTCTPLHNTPSVLDQQMAFHTHVWTYTKPKLHARTHAYACGGGGVTQHPWHHMRLIWKEVTHTLSYMQTHALALIHVFMVTHTVHTTVAPHAHWWSATYSFWLLWTRSRKSHRETWARTPLVAAPSTQIPAPLSLLLYSVSLKLCSALPAVRYVEHRTNRLSNNMYQHVVLSKYQNSRHSRGINFHIRGIAGVLLIPPSFQMINQSDPNAFGVNALLPAFQKPSQLFPIIQYSSTEKLFVLSEVNSEGLQRRNGTQSGIYPGIFKQINHQSSGEDVVSDKEKLCEKWRQEKRKQEKERESRINGHIYKKGCRWLTSSEWDD